MARLSAAERAKLPDRAFAYVDSRGRRRLPIMDSAHVRNALARFNQVDFESEAKRDEARLRLLKAARRFRIVPVGFISGQLEAERAGPPRRDPPTGFVTMLMTDIEGSTALVERLGDAYAALLDSVREVQRTATESVDGFVVEARADEFFATFANPRAALDAAIAAQRDLAGSRRPNVERVRIRSGLHAGYPTMSDANYIGMAVHLTARVCSAAHGGQILVSEDFKTALTGMTPEGVRFRDLGSHRLKGIKEETRLYQVGADGLARRFPVLRV